MTMNGSVYHPHLTSHRDPLITGGSRGGAWVTGRFPAVRNVSSGGGMVAPGPLLVRPAQRSQVSLQAALLQRNDVGTPYRRHSIAMVLCGVLPGRDGRGVAVAAQVGLGEGQQLALDGLDGRCGVDRA